MNKCITIIIIIIIIIIYFNGMNNHKISIKCRQFWNEYSALSLSTQNISEDKNSHLLRVFQKTTTV